VAADAGVQIVLDPKRVVLRDAAKAFVQAAEDRKASEAVETYEHTVEDLLLGIDLVADIGKATPVGCGPVPDPALSSAKSFIRDPANRV
jgi:hypothetical protein